MSLGCRPWQGVLVLFASALVLAATSRHTTTSGDHGLRVCADPNNLPFSNEAGEGFENAIAEIIADDLGQRVRYTWWPSRRGFFRATLHAGVCDVVMGVPAGLDAVTTTESYYSSTYVFVTRAGETPGLTTLDDPRLPSRVIGLHVVGDDGARVPPEHVLAAHGSVDNVRGYSLFGNYGWPSPPAELIDAVRRGEIDVAVAWGPLAGYFSARTPGLVVTPISSTADASLEFEISLGVRRDDQRRRAQLDAILRRRAPEIRAVLDRFHVPRPDAQQASVPKTLVGDPPGPARVGAVAPEPPLPNPFAKNLEALQRGRRFFVAYNCAGCHGDHGGGGMGPSLRDHLWIYGSSDAQIAASIAEGRAFGMPAWSRMLTTDQIWQITAYIKSMRTPEEPSPPDR
jgi:mxaJ protein